MRLRKVHRCSLAGCKAYPEVATYGRRRWWWGRRRVMICGRHARALAGIGRALSAADTLVVRVDDAPAGGRYLGAHRRPAWTS